MDLFPIFDGGSGLVAIFNTISLLKAIKDRNKIWGVISKTAVNQDGRSVTPITRPSETQQQELLRKLYSDSDIADVQYVEAHGTGTPVGDVTEARSIANALAKAKPPGSASLWVGSVKSNIGHSESAAGMAGLIKVLLMMKHETIVPSLFYSEDSAGVDAAALSFCIPVKVEKWEVSGPRLLRGAGVNSFGFGGTNAHVIVRQHRRTDEAGETPQGGPRIFVVSAASETSLFLSIADTYRRLCREPVDLAALSYTSACRRTHHKHKYRKTFPFSSLSDLKRQLELKPKLVKPDGRRVIFVFCGSGLVSGQMCTELLRKAPVFCDKVREVGNLLESHGSHWVNRWIAGELCLDDDSCRRPDIRQSVLFATQVGIAALLKHCGVQPDAVLGHSVGELAAAHCSGLLSLEDTVNVLHRRSALQSKVTGGKMLVVGNVDVEKVLKILPDNSGGVSVAAFNSPRSCTLSGQADIIEALRSRLEIVFAGTEVFLQDLEVTAAYHSPMMDPILKAMEDNIDQLHGHRMECELISTVTGESCSDDDFRTGSYWARNIREPVFFDKALRAIAAKDQWSIGNMTFVEVGPRRVLQRNIHETLGKDTEVLSSVQPGRDCDTMLSTLARLFELGTNIAWGHVFRGNETLPTTLPVYQFSNVRKELSLEAPTRRENSSAFSPHMLILQVTQDVQGEQECTCVLSTDTVPYIWEHKNSGVPIVPGALFVELVYASAMVGVKPGKRVSFLQLSVRFERPLTLSSSWQQLKVAMKRVDEASSFKIYSASQTHASGTFQFSSGRAPLEERNICPHVIYQRCNYVVEKTEIYSLLSQAGFEYSSIFQQLGDVCLGDEYREAVTVIQLPGEIVKQLRDYYLHPVVLDCFLQMTTVAAHRQLPGRVGFPSAIGKVSVCGPLHEEMILYLRVTQETADFMDVCGCFSTTDGRVLVELTGVRMTFLAAVDSSFFHNETTKVFVDGDSPDNLIKALVFEDRLGVAQALRLHMHPKSVIVANKELWTLGQVKNIVSESFSTSDDLEKVLFLCGLDDLSHMNPEEAVDSLVTCCELLRQVVLASKGRKRQVSIYVVTYRATEKVVDHINPGFVLSGMTRTCAAETTGLFFHLIDLASVSKEDIMTLAKVINSCRVQEVMISQGQVFTVRIAKTTSEKKAPLRGYSLRGNTPEFVLQIRDPYKVTDLTAAPLESNDLRLTENSVEIKVTNICVHSSDYFPVSISQLNYGRTMYWDEHTPQSHKLLCLDFSGIVTAVGKGVSSTRVGDHIATCYPAVAQSKIIVPADVCYSIRKFAFLREMPCVSFFILAWEILEQRLREVKVKHKKMVIISHSYSSALVKVLALAANKSGWNVSSCTDTCRPTPLAQSHAFVFLPPFEYKWKGIVDFEGPDTHAIFICSDNKSSTIPTSVFALRSQQTHLHQVNVAQVLQIAVLHRQSKKISSWLGTLGLDAASLPLETESFQLPSTKTQLCNFSSESYFSTVTVREVALHRTGAENLLSLKRERRLFKQNGVYIVTGGLSGLGLETVKFVARMGGGCIATLSRRPVTDEVRDTMELLRKRHGVKIMNVQCDVSMAMQVEETISKVEQQFAGCTIRGVFHSAAVLHDALIETLDGCLFRKVLLPKVGGALNLHNATLHVKLDFFVCYSSISAFFGNPSQSNYAAANSFLDTFAHYRRNLGLAGQSINWGPLNLGLLLNGEHLQRFLEDKGMRVMQVGEIHRALEKCLMIDRPQQVICKFDFKKLSIHVLSQNASLRERLSDLVRREITDATSVEPTAAHSNIRTIICEIQDISVNELQEDATLHSMGIDSMLAMTLQNRIFQEMGVNVPLVKLLDPNVTLAMLESTINSS